MPRSSFHDLRFDGLQGTPSHVSGVLPMLHLHVIHGENSLSGITPSLITLTNTPPPPVVRTSSTVLGGPPGQMPGTTESTDSPRDSAATRQSRSGGAPDRFAEVAVSGPVTAITSRATGWSTTPTAMRFPPSLGSDGVSASSTNVKLPRGKDSNRSTTPSEMVTHRLASSNPRTARLTGRSNPRPFNSKT